MDPRKILWVKSVTRDDERLAYSGEDETSRAFEPRGRGDAFELHSTEEDAETLAAPAVSDIIVLIQHEQVTHLVEVTGETVEPRPRRTIRRGTRDARYCMQRTCEVWVLLDFETAPMIEDAFGFDPDAKGGEVLELATLPAFVSSGLPLWALQRRIERAMSGLLRPAVAQLGQRRHFRR